jgi:hypothetical protein
MVPASSLEASCQNIRAAIDKPLHICHAYESYLDHHGLPLVALQARDRSEHVFDISMAPVLALNSGDRSTPFISTSICFCFGDSSRDVARAKSMRFRW